MSGTNTKAFDISSPALPHFAGLNWRLDVPMASRSSSAQPKGEGKAHPVYSLRLSLAKMEPNAFSATPNDSNNNDGEGGKKDKKSSSKSSTKEESEKVTSVTAKIEEVAFSCTPETLLALADSVEAAVKQSEQAPYRRILRLIR